MGGSAGQQFVAKTVAEDRQSYVPVFGPQVAVLAAGTQVPTGDVDGVGLRVAPEPDRPVLRRAVRAQSRKSTESLAREVFELGGGERTHGTSSFRPPDRRTDGTPGQP